jgi:hypothetical protein
MIEKSETDTKVDFYVQVFEKARQRLQDDNAAAAIVEQVGRDVRTALMARQRSGGSISNSNSAAPRSAPVSNGAEPASIGQLDWLRDLGVLVRPGITRAEASDLIFQRTGRR